MHYTFALGINDEFNLALRVILSLLASPKVTLPENVDTPETLKLSKFVWPSTSISALTSILPLNVEIPDTSNLFTLNWLVVHQQW